MELMIWKGLFILSVFAFILLLKFSIDAVNKRDSEIDTLHLNLSREKEKLRLFKLMHPIEEKDNKWVTFCHSNSIKKDEGCFFAYEPDGFIVKKDEFLEVVDRICEVTTMPQKDADYYGHRIANLLNDDK